MKKNKIAKRRYWILVDNDKDIRYIAPYIKWVLKERDKMGWGKVFEVEIKVISDERTWSNIESKGGKYNE